MMYYVHRPNQWPDCAQFAAWHLHFLHNMAVTAACYGCTNIKYVLDEYWIEP